MNQVSSWAYNQYIDLVAGFQSQVKQYSCLASSRITTDIQKSVTRKSKILVVHADTLFDYVDDLRKKKKPRNKRNPRFRDESAQKKTEQF